MVKERNESAYVENWTRTWTNIGRFQEDKGEAHAFQTSRSGNSIEVNKYYNSLYRVPVVEEFHWRVTGNAAMFVHYTLHANAEMRCEQTLLGRKCDVVTPGSARAAGR